MSIENGNTGSSEVELTPKLVEKVTNAVRNALITYDETCDPSLNQDVEGAVTEHPGDGVPCIIVQELYQTVVSRDGGLCVVDRDGNLKLLFEGKERYIILPAEQILEYQQLISKLNALNPELVQHLTTILGNIRTHDLPHISRELRDLQIHTRGKERGIVCSSHSEIQKSLMKSLPSGKGYEDASQFSTFKQNRLNETGEYLTANTMLYLLQTKPPLAQAVLSAIEDEIAKEEEQGRESFRNVLPIVVNCFEGLLQGEDRIVVAQRYNEETGLSGDWISSTEQRIHDLVARTRNEYTLSLKALMEELLTSLSGGEFSQERAEKLGIPTGVVDMIYRVHQQGQEAAFADLLQILASSVRMEAIVVPKDASAGIQEVVKAIQTAFREQRFLDMFGGVNAFLGIIGLSDQIYIGMARSYGHLNEAQPGQVDLRQWIEEEGDLRIVREKILMEASRQWFESATRKLVEGSTLLNAIGVTPGEVALFAIQPDIPGMANLFGSTLNRQGEHEMSEIVAGKFSAVQSLHALAAEIPSIQAIIEENGLLINAFDGVVAIFSDTKMGKRKATQWRDALITSILQQDLSVSIGRITSELEKQELVKRGGDEGKNLTQKLQILLGVQMTTREDDEQSDVVEILITDGVYYVVKASGAIDRLDETFEVVISTTDQKIAEFYRSNIVQSYL
ncbi:hypothetical protein H6763_03775 [Candidatus Nomurabacteria bacterium]|uniref:Uncharacterized protein n=1 Tax=Candidatus Dojkabacteria bacterium TaxID=2099670 RepID=A0A955KXK7_9BACT|nr:hypothetical protein [Candidatus Dojkabacteria bacterium]MCB9789604.1 hypothetical protein [Candidatus Nomurabacteria bacterium]MCB9803924.1 hypothetical protein [Candidatus Nomurabacteria bacterium]